MKVVILAGGLGTRLREAVPDLPKCMAPVNNRPFLSFVVDHLQAQGIEQFIFSLGYKSEAFTEYLAGFLPHNSYQLVIEEEPLGTGGAIQLACRNAKEKNVMVVNGDSIFKTDLAKQAYFHFTYNAHCTLALKRMKDFDRYGVVELNPDHTIASFKEKQFYENGLINGGSYILNREYFLQEGFPEKFSFETDYLQKYYSTRKIYALEQDAYFIDIGIPGDYQKAQTELIQTNMLDLTKIDMTWTLFLDRDGVLNHDKDNDYIRNWEEFRFYEGTLEALAILSNLFGKIVVTTNQKGVGKGLMTIDDLTNIHSNMLAQIEEAGGRIDKAYYCADLSDDAPDRKPNPGMAHQAKEDFPEIDLSKSIIVGNRLSDMGFGRNAGMHTVFVTTTDPDTPFPDPMIDLRFNNLLECAQAAQANETLNFPGLSTT